MPSDNKYFNTRVDFPRRILNILRLVKYIAPYLSATTDRRWAFIFVTRSCNLMCPYCNSASTGFENDISLSKWKVIIDRLKLFKVRTINITGGEPLMRPDIYDLVKYIRQRGILPLMHSNFTFINKSQIDQLAASGLFALYASIDGFGSIGKAYRPQTIELLNYASSKNIIPVVSAVVTAKNFNDIFKLAEIVTGNDLLFCAGLYQSIGGVYSNRRDDLILTPELLEEYSRRLIDQKHKTGNILLSYAFLEDVDKYPNKWKCRQDSDAWLVVNNDGTLMPCQEYATDISILDIDDLADERWRKAKAKIVEACTGCYHHCYYQQEAVRGFGLFKELRLVKHAITRSKI